VVINDLEFPSNVYPWLNLQRRGVRVVTVKSVDGRVPVEAIEQALTAKTRMVAISTVQFTTGYRADLTAIGALCRANGVRFFVDAIQSLGAIPMDVKACGVDYLACGGHKWLCSLEGIGLFYCAKERLDDLDLITAGWHTVADALNFGKIDFTLKGNAQRFEEGTPNLAGIYGLNASLATVTAYGVDRNFAHILSLTDRLIDGLRDAGYDIVSPVERREERSGIVIFAPKNRADTPAVATRLERTDVLVIPRGEGIRVSPHFYNTVEDVERMLGAVSSAS
jgi:selenocysteine lyase/cysteine desulfurase